MGAKTATVNKRLHSNQTLKDFDRDGNSWFIAASLQNIGKISHTVEPRLLDAAIPRNSRKFMFPLPRCICLESIRCISQPSHTRPPSQLYLFPASKLFKDRSIMSRERFLQFVHIETAPITGDLHVASLNPPPPRRTSHLRNRRERRIAPRPCRHRPSPRHLPQRRLARHRRPVRHRPL